MYIKNYELFKNISCQYYPICNEDNLTSSFKLKVYRTLNNIIRDVRLFIYRTCYVGSEIIIRTV